LGAIIFFLIETWFGAAGVWYLVGLGATALVFSLLLPRGLWGAVEARWDLRLLPVGYRLVLSPNGAPARGANNTLAQPTERVESA
jgi:branched-chain amino acid transport system permease protein